MIWLSPLPSLPWTWKGIVVPTQALTQFTLHSNSVGVSVVGSALKVQGVTLGQGEIGRGGGSGVVLTRTLLQGHWLGLQTCSLKTER